MFASQQIPGNGSQLPSEDLTSRLKNTGLHVDSGSKIVTFRRSHVSAAEALAGLPGKGHLTRVHHEVDRVRVVQEVFHQLHVGTDCVRLRINEVPSKTELI